MWNKIFPRHEITDFKYPFRKDDTPEEIEEKKAKLAALATYVGGPHEIGDQVMIVFSDGSIHMQGLIVVGKCNGTTFMSATEYNDRDELFTATFRYDQIYKDIGPKKTVTEPIITKKGPLKSGDTVTVKFPNRETPYLVTAFFVVEFMGYRHIYYPSGGAEALPNRFVTPVRKENKNKYRSAKCR
jgi:hypothetical protein